MKNRQKDRKEVRTWNVTLIDGRKIKAATIEQGPRRPSMCEGCPAPCCQGIFAPILDSEEFLDRKFEHSAYSYVPEWLKEKLPKIQFLVTLNIGQDGCPYFDKKTHKCSIWPNCPKSCLSYDCREDPRPEIREFARKREKEWRKTHPEA